MNYFECWELRVRDLYLSSGLSPTQYQYTGQYSHTADFGLMFYNARWYDPALGRFAQADSIVPGGVQGLDRYAYVNNNPMRYTDPTGHMCREDGQDCEGSSHVKTKVGNKVVAGNGIFRGGNCGGKGEQQCPRSANARSNESIPSTRISLSVPTIPFDDILSLSRGNDPSYLELGMSECAESHCSYAIPYILGEYQIDISRIDGESLAWDYFGFVVSIAGLKPISDSFKLNKTGLDTLSFGSASVSGSIAYKKKDLAGLVFTASGLWPPAAIYASSASVVNDLSTAIRFVPKPLQGPPVIPYCDKAGYGCR